MAYLLIGLSLIFCQSLWACSSYSTDNPFWQIIQKQKPAKVVAESAYGLIIKDHKPRVKVHYLAISKGQYTSFSDFINRAKSEEVVDLIRLISKGAEKLGIKETGYRILTNHGCSVSGQESNNASQDVNHFHVHIVGGECLGFPVVGLEPSLKSSPYDPKRDRYKVNNARNAHKLPSVMSMTNAEFLNYIHNNKIIEKHIVNAKGDERVIIAFNVTNELNLSPYIGFVLLDEEGQPLYGSFDAFANMADADEIVGFLSEIANFIHDSPLKSSGYRLYANSGNDSWNVPKIFQIYVAGGSILGPTVTNAAGNKRAEEKEGEHTFLYYKDLKDEFHGSCKIE